jgi:DNA-binding transcriptional ArsR family regulator
MATADLVFRSLVDPTRRAIFETLAGRDLAVRDLTARFDVSQPAISQHLAVLRASGLVRERREGRLVYYRAEPRGLRPLVNWLEHYRAFWPEHLEKLRSTLEEME